MPKVIAAVTLFVSISHLFIRLLRWIAVESARSHDVLIGMAMTATPRRPPVILSNAEPTRHPFAPPAQPTNGMALRAFRASVTPSSTGSWNIDYFLDLSLKAFTMNTFRMTRYPRNSPRAAGRIVALALISNGKLKSSELAALESRDANALLGLSHDEWHDVLEELCADLLTTARRGEECHIDARLVQSLLTDIDEAALQRLVLRLCTEVANADGNVDEAEATVLKAAVEQWGVHPLEHELLEPLLYGMDFQVTARGSLHRRETSARTIGLGFLEQAVSPRKRA